MHAILSGIAASVWSVPYSTYLFFAVSTLAFGFLVMVIMAPMLWRITG